MNDMVSKSLMQRAKKFHCGLQAMNKL